MTSKTFTTESIRVLQITLGIFSAGFGIKGFLLPTGFIDGGVTGVSMLLAEVSSLPISLFLLLINLPFVVIGYRQIGINFALRSAAAIIGLAILMAVFKFPTVTDDKLLTAIFGGFFLGGGIGLTMRGGAVLDGTEIIALIFGKKIGLTVGDVILGINIVIFGLAAILLGIEPALYSILTYFSAAKTIDFILHGIEEYNALTIVSYKSEHIKTVLLDELGRGVTIYQGRGGKSNLDRDILFCVVTRLELPKAKSLIKEIDEEAFIVVHQISDATGGVVKRRVFH